VEEFARSRTTSRFNRNYCRRGSGGVLGEHQHHALRNPFRNPDFFIWRTAISCANSHRESARQQLYFRLPPALCSLGGSDMTPNATFATMEREAPGETAPKPRWAVRTHLLWEHRHMLSRVTAISFVVSLAIAFLIPKQYKSSASIMPPEQQNSTAMMLAALVSHAGSLGALGNLAGLSGGHASADLYIDLLHSGTVSEHLIDRFNLQHVYRKRYRIDAAKHLARITKISENKKSGIITIQVEDTSRERARELTQGYLDELNQLVLKTNTSAAHRERVFIEERLHSVQIALQDAELKLSQFSSKSSAFDIKEQTRAMVDAGARIEAELLVEQSGLQSLRQIYGDDNIRVRQSQARIANLQREMVNMKGAPVSASADDSSAESTGKGNTELYPPLRQLPGLAVSYTDLYRRVKVQETVFELLTQQYEMARIEEAKDVPAVSVIDPPGLAEKKSFPPRLLLTLLLTFLSLAVASVVVMGRSRWSELPTGDPRKEIAAEIVPVLKRRFRSIFAFRRGAA
jgi:capsule polysaccharide export protein KpsE/RkpR